MDEPKIPEGPDVTVTLTQKELAYVRALVDDGYATMVSHKTQKRVQGQGAQGHAVVPSGSAVKGVRELDWVRELAAKLDSAKAPQ